MEILDEMKQVFAEKFGEAKAKAYFSPGRVNLIGEHTDYNGGHVFPCAITLGTYAVAAPAKGETSRVYSMNLPEKGVIEFPMTGLSPKEEYDWANYPIGVVHMLGEAGFSAKHGVDVVFYGTLPNGSGLSSSASIEVLMGVILDDMFGFGIDRVELVKLAQKTENEFVGMNCGIMDQFAVGMGEENKAILLDCNTLEYEMVPVELGNHAIVIMNTKKRRELVDSKYNERRSECEEALAKLQTVVSVGSLGELDEETFENAKAVLESDVLYRRARHAVTENQRTLKAKSALQAGELEAFGQLMNQSHISLRDDYEVTGIELDTLVQAAWDQPGVLGARMTGAGFGGCAIAIVEKDAIPTFIENVGKTYEAAIGYPAEFYIAEISDGAKRL